jgi:hypothetical protein
MKFKFEIVSMTSKGETLNMKIIDLKKLWNFVVDKFLILIRLETTKWFTLDVV